MKLAFKAFDMNLSCRMEKFEIGVTYTKKCSESPRLCTSDGYHYCENIQNLNGFYSNNTSRTCLIEVFY